MKINKLSNEEFNVLNKISSKSKMDCWFYLKEKDQFTDIVYDCENNKELSLYEGISMLDSGITSLEDYNLSQQELKVYFSLVSRLVISRVERLSILLYNTLVYCDDVYGVPIANELDEIGMTQEEYEYLMDFCENQLGNKES